MSDIIKVINIVIHLLVKFHHLHYHGYRKYESTKRVRPEGPQPFKLCRGVQLYPHEKWD